MSARAGRRIRVLVAEDSITIRKRLVEVLAADPEIEVVGEAENGRRAVDLARALRPDVVTMDMMMPEMTGLEATEELMAWWPVPILVVSASMNRGEVLRTFDALAAGAVEVIDKPRGDEVDEAWERKLRALVKLVSRIPVIQHPRARMHARGSLGGVADAGPRTADRRVVAIGGSTGGPAAVAHILGALPAGYALPVLVVVHIGGSFARPFTEWLASVCKLPVRGAIDGEALPAPGRAVVLTAPADRHLVVERRAGALVLRFTASPERHSCRPAVDLLFEALAAHAGAGTIGCLLTGMGRDGAAGLLALRRAGAATIAQDEATSVIYGMPGEAVRLGAAEQVLPVGAIAPALVALAARGGS